MTFYSPNNFKSGRLIFNRYRKTDLLIFSVALVFSLSAIIISINVLKIYHPAILVLESIPAGFALFLIQPLNVYHNFLLYGLCIKNYLKRQKKYKWEGIYNYEIKKE